MFPECLASWTRCPLHGLTKTDPAEKSLTARHDLMNFCVGVLSLFRLRLVTFVRRYWRFEDVSRKWRAWKFTAHCFVSDECRQKAFPPFASAMLTNNAQLSLHSTHE